MILKDEVKDTVTIDDFDLDWTDAFQNIDLLSKKIKSVPTQAVPVTPEPEPKEVVAEPTVVKPLSRPTTANTGLRSMPTRLDNSTPSRPSTADFLSRGVVPSIQHQPLTTRDLAMQRGHGAVRPRVTNAFSNRMSTSSRLGGRGANPLLNGFKR